MNKRKNYAVNNPPVTITLPGLTMLEGKRQAKVRRIPFSRHIAMLIERESWLEARGRKA